MNDCYEKKLTILIATDTYTPDINGVAIFSQRLAEGMQKLGHNVHVIAPSSFQGKSHVEKKNNIIEHRIKSHRIPGYPFLRICYSWQINDELSKLLDQLQPDLLHVQSHFTLCKPLVMEAYRRKIPILATSHSLPEAFTSCMPFPNWIIKPLTNYIWSEMSKVFNKASTITSPSEIAAKIIGEHLKLSQVLAVSNGIDPHLYELKIGELTAHPLHPTVLFVGRLTQDKNIDVLIHAIKKTPKELNIHLKIVGEGIMLKELKCLTIKLQIEDKVAFTGALGGEELRQAYLQSTVFCMPSIIETQSLATLEAMSASSPVILANAMALPFLIPQGKNGYLFAPGDSSDLEKKITKMILESEETRKQMGYHSRQIVNEHHIKNTLINYEALYKKNILSQKVSQVK